jgi:hypothetical protein
MTSQVAADGLHVPENVSLFQVAMNHARKNPWQWGMAAFCFCFGLALIANVQLAADGVWFWYAVLHQQGARLYADLHMVQQPLMVLETQGWMKLAGRGWLVSKMPALVHLLVFVTALALINTRSRLSDRAKAITLACAFFAGTHFEAYRFDDYHVVEHDLYLLSILLLFHLNQRRGITSNPVWAALLGLLGGLAVMTRLVDGVGLCCITLVVIFCLASERKLLTGAIFAGAVLLTLGLVLLATGDTLRDYLHWSIGAAAGAKGGTGHVLLSPLLLPWHSAQALWESGALGLVFVSAVPLSWVFLIGPFMHDKRPSGTIRAFLGLVVAGYVLYSLQGGIVDGAIVNTVSAGWVLLAYALAVLIIFRLAASAWRQPSSEERRSIILLLPIVLLVAGSTSSGGHHFGLYAPIYFIVLLLPVVFPQVFERKKLTQGFLALLLLIAVSAIAFRSIDPASWNNYRCPPMFTHRAVIHHPAYGPMVIDENLQTMATMMCDSINDGGRGELLSTPFTYVNYYCAIPPWHGYVQTFFDTTSAQTINDMVRGLQTTPPRWILYERQPNNLIQHELVFHDGADLPYREFDSFLVMKVNAGQWHVVQDVKYGGDSDWLLLRTD